MLNKFDQLSDEEFIALVNEMCQDLINRHEVKTTKVKTCRNTFNRNRGKMWLNSIWKLVTPDEI